MTMTALDRRKMEELEPGDMTPEGTVFVGISPDTCKPVFVAPMDEPLAMTWEHANRTAGRKSSRDVRWRLPTDAEHTLLRRVRNEGVLRGTFNDNAWYWSGAEVNRRKARTWNYGEGNYSDDFKFRPSAVRLVRE